MTVSIQRANRVTASLHVIIWGISLCAVLGQEEKASFDPLKENDPSLLTLPYSGIDKLIALEIDADAINWREAFGSVGFNDSQPAELSLEALCLRTGFAFSDAVLAVKGKNADGLAGCLNRIDELREKCGFPGPSLTPAHAVMAAAQEDDWKSAFLRLSALRQSVLRELDGLSRSYAVLAVCGSWVQASRVALHLIATAGDRPRATNYLRDGRLLALMISELRRIPETELRESRIVLDLTECLTRCQEIVLIDKDPERPEGQISPSRLSELRDLLSGFIINQG